MLSWPESEFSVSATASPCPMTPCWAPALDALDPSDAQLVKNVSSWPDRPLEVGSSSPAWTWLRSVEDVLSPFSVVFWSRYWLSRN